MAKTRGASGITVPRVLSVPTSSPATRQTATKKKTITTKKPAAAKANTSKPRAKKTATGRVAKSKAPAAKKAAPKKTATKKAAPKTENKREPSLLDKVQGVAEKIVGVIEGKPGKKVCFSCFFFTPLLLGGGVR